MASPTTAQVFFLNTGAADVALTDIRAFDDSDPGNINLTDTICDFGNSGGEKTIIVDPQTTRTTSGTGGVENFGWAINRDNGSDDMDATAERHRYIPAGTWDFEGRLQKPLGQTLSTQTDVFVWVYKVASNGTRTVIDGRSQVEIAANVSASNIGTNWSGSLTSMPEIELTDNETIQVSYALRASGTALNPATIQFGLQRSAGGANDDTVTVPSPGVRSIYQETALAVTLHGSQDQSLTVGKTFDTTAIGTQSFDRALVLLRTLSTTAIGTQAYDRLLTFVRTLLIDAIGTQAFARALDLARTFDTTAIGTQAHNRLLRLFRTSGIEAIGTADFDRLVRFFRTFDAVGAFGVLTKKFVTKDDFDLTGVGTQTKRIDISKDPFSLIGIGTQARQIRVRKDWDLTGIGTADFDRSLQFDRTFTLTGIGTTDFDRSLVLFRSPTITAVGTQAVDRSLILSRTFGLTGIGTQAHTRLLRFFRTFDTTGIGAEAHDVSLAISRQFSIVAVGTEAFTKVVIFVRSFDITAVGDFNDDRNAVRVCVPTRALSDPAGGSTVVRPFYILD